MLSQRRDSVRPFGMSMAIGEPEALSRVTLPQRDLRPRRASLAQCFALAAADGAASVDGQSGALLEKVSLLPGRQFYPDWRGTELEDLGERHRSGCALAAALGDLGLCLLLPASSAPGEVKVCVRGSLFVYTEREPTATWVT